MAFILELYNRWVGGSLLAVPADLMPNDRLRVLRNARLDLPRGVPKTRPGLTKLTTISGLPDAVLAQGVLNATAALVHYAQGGGQLQRRDVAWQGPVVLASGLPPVAASLVPFVDGATTPWMFVVGPTQLKDNGTTQQAFGIAPPATAPAQATVGTRNRTSINTCDLVGSWVGTNTGALAIDSTVKQEGAGSLTTTVAPNTLGQLTLPLTGANSVHSGTHTGGNGSASLRDFGAVDFTALPIFFKTRVRNTTQNFSSDVTRITPHELFFDDAAFAGGTWNTGDTYDVYFNLGTFDISPTNTTGVDNSGINNKTTRLIDTTKDFVLLGVLPGMTLRNLTTGAHAVITSVGQTTNPNDTLHFTGGLTGGLTAVFDSGNLYTVINDIYVDDDWIHLAVRVDFPERLLFMQIDFDCDVGGGTFANNYFSVHLSANRLSAGANQWSELFVRKSELQRFGTATFHSWHEVIAARVSFQTDPSVGGITVFIDDLSCEGGVAIEADTTDPIIYTGIYKNTVTGGRSAPPKDPDEVVLFTSSVTVKRQPVTLDLTTLANPTDTQVGQIWLYRKGGGLQDALLLAKVDRATTTFIDQKANGQLSTAQMLEPDNDPPPSDLVRLFGPGAFQRLFGIHKRNKVRVSKQWQKDDSRAENWPTAFEFQIGDGAEEALNGTAGDTLVLIWTDQQAWYAQGTSPDTFLPLPIPLSRGLAAPLGLAVGDGQAFILAKDGIYSQVNLQQTPLTGDIAGFFAGETIDGIQPINPDAIATSVLTWHPHPQGNELVLLYPPRGAAQPLQRLVLKKNLLTGHYTDCYFDDGPVPMRSALSDPVKLALTLGGQDGHIYAAEESAPDDAGTAIAMRVMTKTHDQGQPRATKTYSDVVVEAATVTETLALQALLDKSRVALGVGTVASGPAGTVNVQLPLDHTAPPSVSRYRSIALDLTTTTHHPVLIEQLGWHVQLEPEARPEWETGTLSFATPQHLRVLLVDIDTPADASLLLYTEGILRTTRIVVATVGRQRVNVYLPNGLKGKSLAAVVSSATDLLLYGITVVAKAVGAPVGWSTQTLYPL